MSPSPDGKTGSPSFLINLFESSDSIVSRPSPHPESFGPFISSRQNLYTSFNNDVSDIMRSWYILLVSSLIFSATALDGEDYLEVIGPSGRIAGANYSEYGPGFQEFVAEAPGGRNPSSYPAYLIDFLERNTKAPGANYSHYSPAFDQFMNMSDGRRMDVSIYPEYLRWFLSDTPESFRTNYSHYSPAFEDFMNMSGRRQLNLSSYPEGLSRFLSR